MNYTIDNKKIRIPDAELANTEKALKVSREEAIKIWLEDEGYLENAEQEELDKKAKENRITSTIHKAKNPNKNNKKEHTRKEDPTKEKIIADIANLLRESAEDVKILNIGKLISFRIGEEEFEIDLKRKRKPKS